MNTENKHKTSAWLIADMDRNAIGLPARLAENLAGKPVLRRTLERLAQAKRIDEIIIFCTESQQAQIQSIISDFPATIVPLKNPVPISRKIRKRKWSLESYRGGLGEATWFDELQFTPEMIEYGRNTDSYTILPLPPDAVLIDPELTDELLDHHEIHGDAMRFTFSQAAPGLCGGAYRIDLLHELVQSQCYIGDLLAYVPDSPHSDFIAHECTYKVHAELYTSTFRFLPDTQRSWIILEKILQNPDAHQMSARQAIRAVAPYQKQTPPFPRELEIEITNSPSLRINGYPHRMTDRSSWATQRDTMPLELFEKIVNDCQGYDDICLTLGGFGEPLTHPDLPEMIKIAKSGGIFAINIETDGQDLKEELADTLIRLDIETISVFLDANTPEDYHAVKSKDCFKQIEQNMLNFLEKCKVSPDTAPVLVPHLIKSHQTLGQMEPFYDRWRRAAGAAVITGYNDYAGQIDDQAVMNMAPPSRTACNRIHRILTILADGSIPLCSQDYAGQLTFDTVKNSAIRSIWLSETMENLRNAHNQNTFTTNQLCQNCKEWHR
ncbi:MAG: SPASM domain-containing protein [Phycisphaerae bacterium]|nr:SPASM domain-containing protein [Phycisphaerae bacterium]